MPTVAEKQKSRGSPHKIEASDVIDFIETHELTVNTKSTKNNTFNVSLQPTATKQKLRDREFLIALKEI